jgi:hypothetical protein
MCHERYWQRREEAAESRRMWMDFELTEPLAAPEPPEEVTEPAETEAREEAPAER